MELEGLNKIYGLFRQGAAICTDTRNITQGCIFFALKGSNFNGNNFVKEALEKGAEAAVADEPTGADPDRVVQTGDVLQFLQQLATHHRRTFGFPFIGITGSNGKTTTKELINRVLSKKYNTACTKGNLNNHIGVPLTLLSVTSAHELAIIEMGANHQQEIELLCSITEPTHVLITNVGKAHLEGFGGFEGVMKGKGEMYEFARANGAHVFINNDNQHLKKMLGHYDNCIRYGTTGDCDITGRLKEGGQYVSLDWKLNSDDEWQSISSNITGNYNFENIMSAIAAGVHFGVEKQQIKEAVESYIPDNQRSQEIIRGENHIIMDAYNANPTSMEAALKNFAALSGRPKAVFLGEMLELGEESETEHQRIVDLVKNFSFQIPVLVGENFRKTAEANNITFFSNSAEAGEWLRKNMISGYWILIKGSRGSKMEKVLEAMS